METVLSGTEFSNEVRALLARADPGDRLEVIHTARQSFRWWFLLELAIVLTCCVLIVGLFAIAPVQSSTPGDSWLDLLKGPFYRYHRITVRLMGPGGLRDKVIGETANAAEANTLRMIVLNVSNPPFVSITEEGPLEAQTKWFPGEPMLSLLNDDVARALEALRSAGAVVETSADQTVITVPAHKTYTGIFSANWARRESGWLRLTVSRGKLLSQLLDDPRDDEHYAVRAARVGKAMYPWDAATFGTTELWLLTPEGEVPLPWTSDGPDLTEPLALVLRHGLAGRLAG